MDKKKIPAKKRVRVPTQKMKDLQSSPPPNEQSGCFAFVRWEDGYTKSNKIFTGSDILTRDEAPVQLQDLRSGNPILAKWSDGKFYRATVEYISGEDQAKPSKVHPTPQESFLNILKADEPLDSTSGSDTIIIDRSPLSEHGKKIQVLCGDGVNPSPDEGHETGRNTAGPPPYGSTNGDTTGPSPYGGNTASPSPYDLNTSGPSPYGGNTASPSPYGLNTFGPSPYGGHTPSPLPYGFNTSGPSPYGGNTAIPSPYGLNTSGPSPYGGNTASPSPCGFSTSGPSLYRGHTPSTSPHGLNTSGPSLYGGHTPSTSPHGFNTSGPSLYGGHTPSTSPHGFNTSGPSFYGGHTPCTSPHDLNTSGSSLCGGHTPSTSPHGLNTSGSSLCGGHTPSTSPHGLNTSGSSLYVGHTPSTSLHGLNTSGPSRRDAGSSSDEGNLSCGQQAANAWTPCDGCKGEVERIDPGQIRELQTLCDLIGERHCDSPSTPLGQQELFPGSSLFISSFRLAAMNQASKPHSMRLFHALFDHFFTVEECQNAVPFGRHGSNHSGKEGKRVLDRKKVDGILTYVLRCASLPGWEQIEEAKLKKAFINKCRARAASKE